MSQLILFSILSYFAVLEMYTKLKEQLETNRYPPQKSIAHRAWSQYDW